MRLLRRYAGYLLVLLLGLGTWAAVYAYDKGFSKKWRNLIMEEFERRGIEAEIGKLTIDPIEGLVARNVKIFATEKRKSVVASINNITLDIDLAKLLRKELFLNTIKLRDADISLPINPMQPDTERLEIKNFSARIQIPGNRFEIEQAECLFNGFRVTLVGSLLQPKFDASAESKNQQLGKLDLIRQRREVFAHIAREMRKFQIPRDHPPHIHIELIGDLEHLETIEATLRLTGSNVGRNNYYCKTLDVRAEYHHPDILIDQIKITDDYGELYADAKWRIGSEQIPFSLKSSVDSHALLQSLLETASLGEVVFFDPPELEVKGEIYVAGEKAQSTHRMQAVGSFECNRFVSRGKIFEKAYTDFSIDPERWYVRNLFLGHKSGTASGNALSETSGQIRYNAKIEMDPTTFTPFFPAGNAQDLMDRFQFNANPAVYIHFSGAGPSINSDHWKTTGHCRIGHCTYRDFPLVGVSGTFKIHAQDITFQDFRIEPEEGQHIDGKLAQILGNEELVILEGLRGKAHPAQVVAYFAPETAEVLARYHFETPPDLTLEGTIDSGGHGRSQFTSTFHSPGEARVSLFKNDLSIIAPEGTVTIKGSEGKVDVKGNALGGQAHYKGSFDIASRGSISGRLKVINGDIFAMPFMGAISRQLKANIATKTVSLPFLISGVLDRTKADYSEGSAINVSFRNEGDGIVHIEDFKGVAPGFSLQAKGKINTLKVQDQLDITAEMNARGPLKIVGWPIAKLFKYQCEGSLDAPTWRPVNFTLPHRNRSDGQGTLELSVKTHGLLRIPRLMIRPRSNAKTPLKKQAAGESTGD